MTARQFSVLYNLVARRCQDVSSNGIQEAKDSINTIIKEITREFRLPNMFKGQDKSVFVTPAVGVGPQSLVLPSDVSRLENIYWIDNNSENYGLDEAQSDEEWLASIDNNTDGDPQLYRDFETNSAGVNQLYIWPSPNTSWVDKSGGKLYISYWSELVPLVNDSDIPNLPYELDTILVNGGIVEMARSQGDTSLIGLYESKYQDDKGEMRAWILKQTEKDVQMMPAEPLGQFGREGRGRGYRVSGSTGL